MKKWPTFIGTIGVILFCTFVALFTEKHERLSAQCDSRPAPHRNTESVSSPVIATVQIVEPYLFDLSAYKVMPKYIGEPGPMPREVKTTLYTTNPDKCDFFVKLITDDAGWYMDGGYALKLKLDGGTISLNTHYSRFNIEINDDNFNEMFSPPELTKIMKAFDERLKKETKIRDDKRLEEKRLLMDRFIKGAKK